MNNDITNDEMQMIMIMRSLRPFETLEFKLNDSGELVYVYTRKERYVVLTKK